MVTMTGLTADLNLEFLKEDKPLSPTECSAQKFGTFLGVFVPSMLMLFGVIIFLRLGWIVGISGLPITLVIITIATLIALITVLSMSAIATNIEVKAGGIYYILSRSLGLEVGSAVGLPLFFKQSLTIAFCVIGFAESLKDLIPSWDITSIGLGTLAALTLLAYTSVRWAMKVQLWIFVAIMLSFVSLFTGSEVAPMTTDSYVPASSLQSIGFWAIFAIFFPAMTGVESSVSLSGDLRNPSKSFPLGTISAVIAGFIIYTSIAIFLSYRVPIDRLVEDPLIMQDLASIPSLIIVGIWGATLSSALGGLLGAPRTLKAIADDGIAPKIFSKTFGVMEEPRIATLATCAVAFLGVCFGSVNVIAPLLTMITLICYGVLNLSAGIETLIANPSWRPRVKIHWSISITGALLCFIAMLMIEPGYALLSLFLVGLIYFILRRREFKSSWLDIHQGILLFFAQSILYRLTVGNSAAKSWRPHFLIFTKFSEKHSIPLLEFSAAISQSKGFLTTASFVPTGTLTFQKQKEMQKEMEVRFQTYNIQSFVKVNEAKTIIAGMRHMINYYGIGPLAPNTILFGGIKKGEKTAEFIEVIQSAISRHYNIVIMNDEDTTTKVNKGISGDIHLWWDDSNPDNSDFMLVLAYMLQRNQGWKNKRIFVKAIVTNEQQKKVKLDQFQKLSIEKRLPIEIDLYVSSFEISKRLDLVKEFSKDAEIILMSLNPPPTIGSNLDEYINYLQFFSQGIEDLPSLTLTLSSEHTPLNVILS
jgi:solute carrier family 12 (potassium/chloride transporter), member 4/6